MDDAAEVWQHLNKICFRVYAVYIAKLELIKNRNKCQQMVKRFVVLTLDTSNGKQESIQSVHWLCIGRRGTSRWWWRKIQQKFNSMWKRYVLEFIKLHRKYEIWTNVSRCQKVNRNQCNHLCGVVCQENYHLIGAKRNKTLTWSWQRIAKLERDWILSKWEVQSDIYNMILLWIWLLNHCNYCEANHFFGSTAGISNDMLMSIPLLKAIDTGTASSKIISWKSFATCYVSKMTIKSSDMSLTAN